MATCPACDFDEIDTADYEEGDEFSCPECGKGLVFLGGLGSDQVDLAADDDLDDDDDDDDDDEDDEDDDEEDVEDDDIDDEDGLDEEEDFDE